MLVFVLHTNIVTFEDTHDVMKDPYIQAADINRYFGQIMIYNFMSDSIKFHRVNDPGYLLARLLINHDGRYIIEGEGKLGHTHLRHESRWESRRQRALQHLDTISPRLLTNEQQLDRLAWRSQLLRESEDFTLGRQTMDPSALDTVLSLLLHELMRGDDEPARAAANLRGLLRAKPIDCIVMMK